MYTRYRLTWTVRFRWVLIDLSCSLPFNQCFDFFAQVFIFTASPTLPKNATLGRLFQRLSRLEHIEITYAGIPSLGEASFWPGSQLLALNLSHNRISLVQTKSFLNLSRLHTLDLSHNRLQALPSGAFFYLRQLSQLNLAYNRLSQLAPSVFLNVLRLRWLDLSWNPLKQLQPADLRGLDELYELRLAGCRLTELNVRLWSQLAALQTLDVTGNRLQLLPSDAFRSLQQLRNLQLGSNEIRQLGRYAFAGCRLSWLDLSNNRLTELGNCTFCDGWTQRLDLGGNQLSELPADRLDPLAERLQWLRLAGNSRLGSRWIHAGLHRLGRLQHLDLAQCSLDDLFQASNALRPSAQSLVHLNLSGNVLVNLSAPFFAPFDRLQRLDLSSNRIFRLGEQTAKQFARLSVGVNSSLQTLLLHSNPFRCFTCHVLPLRDLFRLRPVAYFAECDRNAHRCAHCAAPVELVGQPIHRLEESRIHFCTDPSIFQRLYTSEPRLGLILALIIICSILIIIILIVFKYRQKGATYYTNEDKLNEKTLFTIQQVAKATAFSPSLTSPSSSSPTNSDMPTLGGSVHRQHRHHYDDDDDDLHQHPNHRHHHHHHHHDSRNSGPFDRHIFSRQLSSDTGDSNRDLERSGFVDIESTGAVRRPPPTAAARGHTFGRQLTRSSQFSDQDLRRFGQPPFDRVSSVDRLPFEPIGGGVVVGSGGSSAGSGQSTSADGPTLPRSCSSFNQPISEHLICTSVNSIRTQPIYSQPTLAGAPITLSVLSTAVHAPGSSTLQPTYSQTGTALVPLSTATMTGPPLVLNPSTFVLSPNTTVLTAATPEMIYYSQPRSSSAVADLYQPRGSLIVISRSNSVISEETKPKSYRI